MRRTIAILTMVSAIWVATTTTAEAKDMSGRLGVGADVALGWTAFGTTDSLQLFEARVPGLSLIYNISPKFALQGIVGVSLAKDEASDAKIVFWNTAIRGIINFPLSEEVNLGALLGLGLSGFRTNPEPGPHTSGIWFSVELGIRPEWFVTDSFSLHTQVGVAIAILDNELSASNDGAIGVDIFGNANLFGNAGFTFWFN